MSSPSAVSDELITIATIGRAVGISGMCSAFAQGQTLAKISLPATVFVGKNETDAAPMTITSISNVQERFKLEFEECKDRTFAEHLCNSLVFIKAKELPILPENGYYHFELIGMTVVTNSNAAIVGTVKNVINYPTVDALEIVHVNGTIIEVPLTKDTAQIDKTKRLIILDKESCSELL